MADLVIKNGLVVTPQGVIPGGLSVSRGKIDRISVDASLPKADVEVDAEGHFLLPGLIDPHTHMGMGVTGRGQGEAKYTSDFENESIAAAVGGITTILTTALFGRFRESLLPCLLQAKSIASRVSLIDFRITAILMTQEHLAEIPRLIEEGFTSFKFLMAYRGKEARQIGSIAIDWGFLYRGLETIARCGPPALAMVHAEESEVIDVLRERLSEEAREDLAAWTDSRPSLCETMHVYSAGLIAGEVGAPLYIVHVSARESVEALRYLRGKGVHIYGETCPHYLALTKEAGIGLLAKVNPPLREEADSERLWMSLRDGALETIGSDHCALQRWQKEEGGLWDGMPGFGAMGATLPLLLTEGVHKGRLTMEQLAKITAENTARIFGIYPQKGALAPGSDADIVVVDPNKEWVITAENQRSGSDFSIYEGKAVRGKAIKTFVRGKLVAADGQPVAKAPHGAFVSTV